MPLPKIIIVPTQLVIDATFNMLGCLGLRCTVRHFVVRSKRPSKAIARTHIPTRSARYVTRPPCYVTRVVARPRRWIENLNAVGRAPPSLESDRAEIGIELINYATLLSGDTIAIVFLWP